MSPYIFQPTTTDQFFDWSDPTIWIGGAIPDVPSAEVVIQAGAPSGGITETSFISIASDESYSVDSVQLASDFLTIDGDLTVAADFAIQAGGAIDMEGGTLDVGTLENDGSDIQGYGQLTATGVLTNSSEIAGEDLTLTLGGLVNSGTLAAVFGNLVVLVPSGFAQFSDGSLTGGSYIAGYAGNTAANSNTLYFDIGGVVTTDGAAMTLNSGGAIDSFDSASWSWVPIQSTLNLVSAAGSLSLAGQSYDWETPLTVAGALSLLGGAAEFNGPELVVDPGGIVNGAGIIEGPVANSGAVLAGLPLDPVSGSGGGTLDIQSSVSGAGTIEINPTSTLELAGPDSNDISFADGTGTLQLDDPSAVSGTITLGGLGDQIILEGVSYASVTGYAYAGSAAGGALTIYAAGTAYTLSLAGDYDSSSFALSAVTNLDASNAVAGTRIEAFGSFSTTPQDDFLGNGTSDVLLQNGSTVVDWILKNGEYASVNILSTAAAGWSVVGTGDFTGNGTSDVLLQNGGTVVDWLMNNGVYQGGNVLGYATGYKVVGTGDFTGNGVSDVLLQNGGTVIEWLMNNGVYQSGSVLGSASGYNVVCTGDFAGNGTDDVLLQNGGTVVDWIMQDGKYVSGNVLSIGGAAGWTVVGTGDFTGNDTDDVLLQKGNTVVDWIMQDGKYASGNVVSNNTDGFSVVGTGDYNGDGTSDILLQKGGTVVDWIMKDGAYQSGNVLTTAASGWTVAHS